MNRRSERGNVFFAILGAVALVGVLTAAVSTFVKGPLATSVKITRMNTAENQMSIASQVAVMAAANAAGGGDCDSDTFVEPLEWREDLTKPFPTGGGLIPMSIGISKKDPWGTEYGYCVWDHGPSTNGAGTCGGASQKRLEGHNSTSYPVVALVSAGPDKTFTTTCRSFAAADTNSNGNLDDVGVDLPLVGKADANDDDIIFTYTYEEATGASGGLWSLKSGDPGTAVIDKKIETTGVGSFAGGILLPDSSLIACDPTTAGIMAKNASGTGIKICDGTSWQDLSGGGGGGSINDLSDGITDYATLFNVYLGDMAGSANTTGQQNTALGASALQSNTTGNYNAAIGYQALRDNTASYNTAIGYQALRVNTTGNQNTAVGTTALSSNTNGTSNTAVGQQALYTNISGNANTAVGNSALYANTTGGANIAVGNSALYANTTGGANIAVGTEALNKNTTGGANIAVGTEALNKNTTGGNNTAVGSATLYFNTTGMQNTALGRQALYFNTTGRQNTAVGTDALRSNTTGNYNTALGYQALNSNTTAAANIALGYQALFKNTTGGNNTALGYQALNSNTTGGYNTAVGVSALYANTTGGSNTALGYEALITNTTGPGNTALGYQALSSNTTGQWNTAVGNAALQANTNGGNNTALGPFALSSNTTGNQNTAIGYSALRSNTTGGSSIAIGTSALRHTTTGQQNIAIGESALFAIATGSNNTAIGYGADADAGSYNNSTALGNGATITASNQIVLGNTSIAEIRAQVTSITAISDARHKKDVAGSDLGLDFIDRLRPVSYRHSNGDDTLRYGFLAQDVEQALPPSRRAAVAPGEHSLALIGRDADDAGTYHMAYGELTAPIVKAIQEQQRQIRFLTLLVVALGSALALALTWIAPRLRRT